jgi:RNA polymerase-binding transcription factor
MKHLKHSQMAQLDRSLEQQALELRREIRRLLLESDQQHHRDLAGLVHDAGDEAVANELADIGAAFIDRHVRELREVEAARARLTRGTFGICMDCGMDIQWERLAVYPVATRCADCARTREKSGAERMPTL